MRETLVEGALMPYTLTDLLEDQILIGRLLETGLIDKAREHLQTMFLVADDHALSAQISGMQFMFDLCHPRKRGKG